MSKTSKPKFRKAVFVVKGGKILRIYTRKLTKREKGDCYER